MRILLISVIIIVGFLSSTGQTVDPEGNWRKEILGVDDYYSRFDLKRYSLEDVVGAKARYLSLKSHKVEGEWEGVYRQGTALGTAELLWTSKNGFVYTYIYHTLAELDFGKSISTDDSVTLMSESSLGSRHGSFFADKLIKVRFGKSHYLVPRKRLRDFAERAVGLNSELEDWGYYWQKVGDTEKELFGLPILPKQYSNLIRTPIKTHIVNIGKQRLVQNKFDDGTINYEEIYIDVTLGIGREKGVRTGMNFFVDDLGEWVEITKVLPKKSYGKIRRSLDKSQVLCLNAEGGQGDIVPCKPIRAGMSVRTKRSDLFF